MCDCTCIEKRTSTAILRLFLLERENNHLLSRKCGVGSVFIAPNEFVILMAITGQSGRSGASNLASQIMDLVDEFGQLAAIGLKLELIGASWSSPDDGGFDYTLKYAKQQEGFTMD